MSADEQVLPINKSVIHYVESKYKSEIVDRQAVVWQTLSKHGMKHWLGFTADDKKKLVVCLQPDLLDDTPLDPNSTKPITRRAYEHNIEQELPPKDEASVRDAFHTSLGVYKASSQSDNRPLKSSVSPAHPAFLADNPEVLYKKEGSVCVPVGHSSLSAKFHHWSPPDCEPCVPPGTPTTVYHSNKTNVSTPGYAMVDRGANGCIIGNDACLISKDIPPRYVNVTGINNHQIQNIPIATCGAYSVSNRGPVIVIFHECAYTGQHPSILSSAQMEAYFSQVDDTSIKAGGTQVITTTDGHVFPLSIRHGLPYLAMRKYTSEEYAQLPHVVMTSDKHWNPSVLDGAYTPQDDLFVQRYLPKTNLLPYQDYDEFGAPRGTAQDTSSDVTSFMSRSTTSPILQPLDKRDASVWLSLTDYIHQEVLSRCSIQPPSNSLTAAPHIQSPTALDYLSLKPFFGWVSLDRIKATFDNSTQYGSLSLSPDGNIFKGFQSPQPVMNVRPFHDGILSDVIYSDTPAVNGGSKLAQVFFGRKSHIIHVEEMRTTADFLPCFQIFCTPPHLWLLCMTYIAGLLNHLSDPNLSDKQPIFIATGVLGDISPYISFFWFEPVYYKTPDTPFGSQTTECLGHFVGLVEHVGNGLCFKIWDPITNKLLDRSGVCTALNQEHCNKRVGLFTDDGFIAWRKAKDAALIPKSFGDSPSHQPAPQTASELLPTTPLVLPQPSLPSFLYSKVPNTPSYAPSPLPTNYGEIFDDPSTSHIFSKNPNGIPLTEDDFDPPELAYFDVSEVQPPPTNPATPSNGPSEVVVTDEESNAQFDDAGKPITIPAIPVDNLQGCSFLMALPNGTQKRLTIVDVKDSLEKNKDFINSDAMPIHQSNMSNSTLKLLFPSFDLKLAHILHATLDVPQEAHNHLCESLIPAGATTWTQFIHEIHEYGYIADLEYRVQTGYRSITGRNWYDHNQYTRDVFLAFCNARNQYPGLAAIQNKATATNPLAPFPWVTKAPLTSQPSVQAKPRLTKPVLTPTSSLVSVSVTPPAPVSSPSPASDPASEMISAPVNNGNLLGPPETHTLAPTTDLPAYIGTPTYTWTYFPSTESVRFRRVVSSTIPIVTTDTPTGDAYSISNREHHSPSPSPSKPSANSRWTFHPKSATVTFHRSPKQFSSHKLSTSIPLLQLPPSVALSKDSAVPSSVHAEDSAIPSSVHAYSQHGASSCLVQKPTYGAHSLTFDSPAVCITKRHRDAIKLKLYHLHVTLLLANWLYDAVT
eukprot:jgi/Psemu1/12096/gm1.12096_g